MNLPGWVSAPTRPIAPRTPGMRGQVSLRVVEEPLELQPEVMGATRDRRLEEARGLRHLSDLALAQRKFHETDEIQHQWGRERGVR